MAKPDMPNFSMPARIVVGFVAIAMVVLLLRFLGYFPFH